jgi:hypothetical protein
VLIDAFNYEIESKGLDYLEKLNDNLLKNNKQEGNEANSVNLHQPLVEKVKKLITIAFSNKQNLVAGPSIANQGIEKARKSIQTIIKRLDEYCLYEFRSFDQVRARALRLLEASLRTRSEGKVVQYRK